MIIINIFKNKMLHPNPNPAAPTQPPQTFTISILDHRLPYDTHRIYDITFDSTTTIQTLLTTSAPHTDAWFQTIALHSPHSLLVGLDIEWRPNFKPGSNNLAATIQICVNNHCLIFQLIHAPFIPHSLLSFLANPNHKFVGVGIAADVQKLLKDYSIHVENFVDLRSLAKDVFGDPEMMRTGIKSLARRVLGKEVKKPKKITMSKWDNRVLTAEQVKYATVDAYVSFEIGRRLYSN